MTDTYSSCYIFENDFSAVLEQEMGQPPGPRSGAGSLFRAEPARGKCHVICFSPRHDLTVAEMGAGEIASVVEAWWVA